MIRQLWPLLAVRDLQRSVAFYRDQLGFAVVGHDGVAAGAMRWCRVERDGASLMLQQAGATGDGEKSRGGGISLYFVCDDVDALHKELLTRGLRLEEPRVAYYGMKQLEVPEPDGYSICFESKTDGWSE